MPFFKKKEKQQGSPDNIRTSDQSSVQLAQKKKNLDLRNSLKLEKDSQSTEDDDEMESIIDPEMLKAALKQLNVKFESEEAPTLNRESVIKINVTQQEPDWTMPWQSLDVAEARGSGAVIEGGYILTAAHVVADFSYIELERMDNSVKVAATVVGICNDSDLALLKPPNDSFLKGIVPLKLGEMPSHRDRVYVAGYPIGGEDISVTEGVVSRIEVQAYSHSLKNLLAITVDAAINSGNSGGPVMNQKGELVGVAFQALEGAEAIGHIVPPFVIKHFLTGIEKFGESYKGFPDLSIDFQTLENPVLRKFLGMKDEQTGVRVVKVGFGGSADGVLKEGDVILKVGDFVVASNGSIEFAKHIHGDLSLAVHKHYVGETVQVEILRGGVVQTVAIKLKYDDALVPLHQYNVFPPYYLYCGILFQPLSFDMLERFFQNMLSAPQELLYLASEDKTKERSEIIVVTRVFRDEVNVGYEGEIFSIITEINGEKIGSLKEMIEKIENPKTHDKSEADGTTAADLTVFKTSKSNTIVLPAPHKKSFKHASHRIQKQYNIKEDRYLPE